jgi:hypothetical protein
LWAAGNLAAAARFARALRNPEQTQTGMVDAQGGGGCGTVRLVGNMTFHAIRSYRDFARNVPLRSGVGFRRGSTGFRRVKSECWEWNP